MNIHTIKAALLGSVLALSLFGCAEGDSFDYNKNVVLVWYRVRKLLRL